MNEDRKREAEAKMVTRTEYQVALWESHMDRLRACIAYWREPGEAIPSINEYLEPCESGESFQAEMKKLIAAGDKAWHEAAQRAGKRVEAWDKLQAELGKAKPRTSRVSQDGWEANGQGPLFKPEPDQE
jgi:hypothetical protein